MTIEINTLFFVILCIFAFIGLTGTILWVIFSIFTRKSFKNDEVEGEIDE